MAKHLESFIDSNISPVAYLQEDSEVLTCRSVIEGQPDKRKFTHWIHLSEEAKFWASILLSSELNHETGEDELLGINLDPGYLSCALEIVRRLRLYELLSPQASQTILKAKNTYDKRVYTELELLEELLPRDKELKLYDSIKNRGMNFFPTFINESIIDKYLEETLPAKLDYRPIKKDVDRREAVRSFWSMISSEIRFTWPKEHGEIVATGSLIEDSPLIQSIIERLGGRCLSTFAGTKPTPIQIDPTLTRHFSSVRDAVLYFERKEFEDTVSPLRFGPSFLYK